MTTSGCHLCDEAFQMFHYLLNKNPKFAKQFKLELVEISASAQLIDDYGTRIPVLKSNKNELGWVFSIDDLSRWLDKF